MFDIFGLEKVNAHDAIRDMSEGVVRGIFDGFDWKLMDKDREIEQLKEEVRKLNNKIEELECKLNTKPDEDSHGKGN
jgi:hypothetical protein